VGRAAAGRPRLLLLDEPAAGLDAEERALLARRIRQLAELGLGVLVVDHDVRFVLGLCEEVVVLDLGEVIAHGPPSAVRADRRVAAAYLGEPAPLPGRHPPEPGPAGPEPEGAETSRRDPPGSAPPTTSPLVLDARRLTAGYGGVPVVRDLDLRVRAGEVVALLGANGAGKTTALRAVCGTLPALSGRVLVLGERVDGRVHRLARRGLAYVPQGRALFPELSVGEHLRLARRRRDWSVDDVLPAFPSLAGLLDRPAGRLSGGEQQLLALARALAAPHRLVVVDEMSLGLGPRLVEQVLATLRRLAVEEGAGVLVVEQHVDLALSVADRAYVLRAGRVVLEAPASVLAGDRALVEGSYLGAPPAEPPPA
jgi:branched-chain amino acid transport system ATP-binding protein